ncbi:hypothetical protein BgiBS90_027337, partial [Biomphalaria glabrata]
MFMFQLNFVKQRCMFLKTSHSQLVTKYALVSKHLVTLKCAVLKPRLKGDA